MEYIVVIKAFVCQKLSSIGASEWPCRLLISSDHEKVILMIINLHPQAISRKVNRPEKCPGSNKIVPFAKLAEN